MAPAQPPRGGSHAAQQDARQRGRRCRRRPPAEAPGRPRGGAAPEAAGGRGPGHRGQQSAALRRREGGDAARRPLQRPVLRPARQTRDRSAAGVLMSVGVHHEPVLAPARCPGDRRGPRAPEAVPGAPLGADRRVRPERPRDRRCDAVHGRGQAAGLRDRVVGLRDGARGRPVRVRVPAEHDAAVLRGRARQRGAAGEVGVGPVGADAVHAGARPGEVQEAIGRSYRDCPGRGPRVHAGVMGGEIVGAGA